MTTATVEVLTAEVRTLMVGSRQVTLSVYRQLDVVPASECEPFGRVSDAKDQRRSINVVGSRDGALVRSAVDVRRSRPWIYVGGGQMVLPKGVWSSFHPVVEVDGIEVALGCEVNDQERGDNEGWTFKDREAEAIVMADAAVEVGYYRRWEEIKGCWEDLPLIVLAGLR